MSSLEMVCLRVLWKIYNLFLAVKMMYVKKR
jgi:hypothetical protein